MISRRTCACVALCVLCYKPVSRSKIRRFCLVHDVYRQKHCSNIYVAFHSLSKRSPSVVNGLSSYRNIPVLIMRFATKLNRSSIVKQPIRGARFVDRPSGSKETPTTFQLYTIFFYKRREVSHRRLHFVHGISTVWIRATS
jgi:hypothetical protein